MFRHSWKAPLAGFSVVLILSGCTTTTRVPLNAEIPPVPPAREGPTKSITGYVAREGGFRQFRGTASALGADSILIQGRDSARATPFGAQNWDRPRPPGESLRLPRVGIDSVVVEKTDKLRTWGLVILVWGAFVAVASANSHESWDIGSGN